MRPRAALLTLVVALALVGAGCAAGPRGATAPHAIEQVLPAKALDVAAARVAARAFVQAYAASATDRGLALRRLVVGRELTRWVRWLGIQNGQFEGAIRAEAEVREVRFLGVALGDTYDVARVRLRATVTFAYAPDGGETFILERVLDGPMLLVRVGQEDWKVADVTREGAPLSEGIRDLGRARVTRDGVAIVLDSAFVFAIGWQVNVTVENRTDGEIRLASVRLVVGGRAAAVDPADDRRGRDPVLRTRRRRDRSDPRGALRDRARDRDAADPARRAHRRRRRRGGVAERRGVGLIAGDGSRRRQEREASQASTPTFARRSASVLRSRRTCSSPTAAKPARSRRASAWRGFRPSLRTL